jgi:hypothetical protein
MKSIQVDLSYHPDYLVSLWAKACDQLYRGYFIRDGLLLVVSGDLGDVLCRDIHCDVKTQAMLIDGLVRDGVLERIRDDVYIVPGKQLHETMYREINRFHGQEIVR